MSAARLGEATPQDDYETHHCRFAGRAGCARRGRRTAPPRQHSPVAALRRRLHAARLRRDSLPSAALVPVGIASPRAACSCASLFAVPPRWKLNAVAGCFPRRAGASKKNKFPHSCKCIEREPITWPASAFAIIQPKLSHYNWASVRDGGQSVFSAPVRCRRRSIVADHGCIFPVLGR